LKTTDNTPQGLSNKKLHKVVASYFICVLIFVLANFNESSAQGLNESFQNSNESGESYSSLSTDSLGRRDLGEVDSLALQDSLNGSVETYSKRNFVHTEQIITASAFMAAIAFLMASMNNFNPKR
jgi:hypothetical protein